jgi:hypothetical protein
VSHTGLDLYSTQSILANFDQATEQQIGSASQPNGRTLDFKINGERNNFIDLNQIYLVVEAQVRKPNGNPLVEDVTDAASLADPAKTDKPIVVNNLLHSLFEDYELRANDQKISSANGRYGHKAFLETEMSSTGDEKETWLVCQGYQYEQDPSDQTTSVFTNRKAAVNPTQIMRLMGKLSIDAFTASPFMLPGVDLKLKLVRSSHEFTTITDDAGKHYSIVIMDTYLLVRKLLVNEMTATSIERRLLTEPAVYQFTEVIPKTFVMSAGTTSWKDENILQNEPIRRLAIAMCTNTAFDGTHDSNPFHYQKFDLIEITLKRNGVQIPGSPLYTEDDRRAYHGSLRALAFNRNSHGIPIGDYQNHYVVVFDLTSTLEASHMLINPETTNGTLHLYLRFGTPLAAPTALFLLAEHL